MFCFFSSFSASLSWRERWVGRSLRLYCLVFLTLDKSGVDYFKHPHKSQQVCCCLFFISVSFLFYFSLYSAHYIHSPFSFIPPFFPHYFSSFFPSSIFCRPSSTLASWHLPSTLNHPPPPLISILDAVVPPVTRGWRG